MASTNQIYNTRRYYYVQVDRQNPLTSQLLSQDPQLVLLLGPSSTVSPNLVSFRTSGGPIPSIPKLFSLFLFFLHSYCTQRFFPGRSEWLRDSCKLLPLQGFPARMGVALPCSRRRRVYSSKITNKNKCIFSHGPTILIFPLQSQTRL